MDLSPSHVLHGALDAALDGDVYVTRDVKARLLLGERPQPFQLMPPLISVGFKFSGRSGGVLPYTGAGWTTSEAEGGLLHYWTIRTQG